MAMAATAVVVTDAVASSKEPAQPVPVEPSSNAPPAPGTGVVHGLMNPQYLKLLSDWGDLYRHLITLAFAQHGPA